MPLSPARPTMPHSDGGQPIDHGSSELSDRAAGVLNDSQSTPLDRPNSLSAVPDLAVPHTDSALMAAEMSAEHSGNTHIDERDQIHANIPMVPVTSSMTSAQEVTITVDPVAVTGDIQEQIAAQQSRLKRTESTEQKNPNPSPSKKRFRFNFDYFRLFRYSTPFDTFLITAGIFCAMGAGVPLPLIGILFGDLINDFSQKLGSPETLSPSELDDFKESVNTKVMYLVFVAIGYFVLTYAYCVCWSLIGERVARRLREEYVGATLRMEVGWFSDVGAGEISNRITSDIQTIHLGTSEKVGLCIQSLSYFVVALCVSFSKNATLAGIMLCIVPAFVIVIMGGSKITAKYTTRVSDAYSKASMLADEAFGNVRVVQAFNSQERLAKVYESWLTLAEKEGVRKSVSGALMMGAIFFLAYSSNALAYWKGSRLLVDNSMSGAGDIFTVIFMMLDSSFIIGHFSPFLQTFSFAAGSGRKLLDTIDRTSPIDPTSDAGFQPEKCEGHLELRGVRFAYPTRPEVQVLKGVDIVLEKGKTTAIVGLSGSGKSTIVGLLERFYDPTSGQILLDNVPISSLNVRWLRRQMALVMQEPVLFNGTIMDNIALGAANCTAALSAREKEDICIDAARKANAHGFISKLPKGYFTPVGEHGVGLSGGQKQRIAIARAIVSDPKILILDEATSALDVQSERLVQAALERASKDRTTVVIAHRLSTIRNAHKIVVMSQGKVIEQGTHEELLARKSAYYRAVNMQNVPSTVETVSSTDTAHPARDMMIRQKSSLSIRTAHSNLERQSSSIHLDSTRTAAPSLSRRISHWSLDSGRFSVYLDQVAQDSANADNVDVEAMEKAQAERNSEETAKSQINITTWELLKRISGMMGGREWFCVVVGLATSAMIGSAYSIEAVLFANLVTTLSPNDPSQTQQILDTANRFCLYFLCVAFALCFAYSTNGTVFGWVSGRLLWRVRSLSFRSVINQDISYFDKPDHTTASLVSTLNVDANHLSGLTGVVIGTVFSIMVNLVAAITLAHITAWKIAIVVVTAVPIMLVAGFLRVRIIARFQKRHETAYIASAALATEAVGNIRTVAALSCEQNVKDRYHESLEAPYQDSIRSISTGNLWLALAYSITYLLYALAYWWGSQLLSKGDYTVNEFFIVLPALLFSAQAAGQMFSLAPDVTKARLAAGNIFRVIDERGAIGHGGESETMETKRGVGIEFRDVVFRYPSRPEVPVLNGLNLKIEPGQFTALVGPSGCGKSTTIALLERFYDPLSGQVLVNSTALCNLHLPTHRSRMALVSQEPTLYEGTIRFNILIGAQDPDAVEEKTFLNVCEMANVHEFVKVLPEGYETVVGKTGLSGGQKQRIAIARALIRDPEILLLDEATSALDSESEELVQSALNKASINRTTISISHRLSTIRHAHKIVVIDQGIVAEEGTHEELMALRGRYFEMVRVQRLDGEVGDLGVSGGDCLI
ncbi:uncharacterized protein SPPG_04909 [Spizellomyces punctatus DAOM BR117]|uniref:Uncharacterized protein n=1 Tax=Spizellomyces punctatus (strain DAOM BR117) TaxID=645134 RepID=A0A0L0HFF0_SPIPD|nr:uncharacterized protein SPPG_04909 [Spizellomyces punctatus DAOM BR117]KNC99518.1 hypothetical protein SPPG_04909 [Spizellomyces punctatus DAOM BR117]|eukprot:XP_016607558.1 hypothetical protein SPPG_04909 [Spizellomyces punctatus DAOM BR117]